MILKGGVAEKLLRYLEEVDSRDFMDNLTSVTNRTSNKH